MVTICFVCRLRFQTSGDATRPRSPLSARLALLISPVPKEASNKSPSLESQQLGSSVSVQLLPDEGVSGENGCWPQAGGRWRVLCVALIPRSSGKQPYLLILLNKWAAFMLSVSGTAENRKVFNSR